MDSLQVAVKSYNYFLSTTLTEGVKLFGDRNSISNEMLYSGTNLHISQEGLFGWIKAKLAKIGQRFVILANKIVAKFSKNRAKLEANIELYKKNPHATVELAISPQAFKKFLVTAGMCVAAGAAIIAVKNRGEARRRKIMEEGLDKLSKIFEEDLKVASSEHSSGKVYKTSAATASKFAQDMKANLEKQSRNVAALAKDMKTSNIPSDPAAAKAKMSSLAKASSDMAKVANMTNSLAHTSTDLKSKGSAKDGVTKADIDRAFSEIKEILKQHHNGKIAKFHLTPEEEKLPGAKKLAKDTSAKAVRIVSESGMVPLVDKLHAAKTKDELKRIKDQIIIYGKSDAAALIRLSKTFQYKLAALKH